METPEPMPTPTIPADAPLSSDLTGVLTTALSIAMLLVIGIVWQKVKTWMAQVIDDVGMTKTQTTNNHDTNLRDDITAIADGMDRVIKCQDDMRNEMRDDQRELRSDIRTTLDHSIGVNKRITEHERDTRDVVAWARRQMGKEES